MGKTYTIATVSGVVQRPVNWGQVRELLNFNEIIRLNSVCGSNSDIGKFAK